MSRIRVAVTIPAPPRKVWADIADIASHVEWMEDAVAIRFLSRKRRGVGTTFDCDTKVGPFRLVDRMEITEWRAGSAMGIRHVGLVTGTGRFTLSRRPRGTRFVWEEELSFPWWMGGAVGALIGGQILRFVWRRNLRNLSARFQGRPG